jgi:thiol-disulfide isomerase/thioredoxin
MKTNLKFTVCALLLIICSISQPALSQSVTPTGAKSHATPQEIQKLKEAVEANPDSLSAHKAYIKAMGVAFDKMTNPELIAQYKKWMEKYPGNINFPFAIGEALWGGELPQAKEYLLKVVQMDPKNATAWYYLSIDADRWGQQDLSKEYMHNASLADPSNAGYAFYYLDSMSDEAPAVFSQKVFDFAKRFPDSERGAQALYWLAARSLSNDDKIKYFEDLRKLYPPAKFDWSAGGMSSLWAAYIEVDPVKALSLANEVGTDDKNWKAIKAFTQDILQERKLVEDHKYSDAAVLLAQTKLPRYLGVDDFFYTEEASVLDKAGNTSAAYDSLIVVFAKKPTVKLKVAIVGFGNKMGKDKAKVEADIWKQIDVVAKFATPFTLKNYLTPGSTSLSDYTGKVVLLTYWFPGCGPCRGEFPHFENVVKKYKSQDLAFVGINIVPDQNEYVVPFMKSSGYSFTPLQELDGRKKGNLDNHNAAPSNYLIDKQGRVVFIDFRINGNNEDDLEMMINMLLQHNA